MHRLPDHHLPEIRDIQTPSVCARAPPHTRTKEWQRHIVEQYDICFKIASNTIESARLALRYQHDPSSRHALSMLGIFP